MISSPRPMGSTSRNCRAVARRAPWEIITPLGNPVVPEGLRRDHGPVELGAVVADDGDLVTAAEAEAGEAEGDAPHVLDVILPRMCLPDPELLLADGHGRSEALGIVERELREGVEAE